MGFRKVSARFGNWSVKCQMELNVQIFVEFASPLFKTVLFRKILKHFVVIFLR